MNVLTLKTDNDFINAVIPEGYVLIFYSLDKNGNIVKRYKDSSGNFGNIGGSSVNDSDVTQKLTQIVEKAEQDKIEISAILVKTTNISNSLDKIIGE